jgi:CheY-like chemotaxis protein
MSRILLADDSPQALRLAERILGGEGIEVVSVTDGAVALRRLQDVKPDILLTDVYLPGQSGFALARFVRSQPEHAHVRIIFAAAPIDEFNEQDAKNAGADVILRKPFEASALLGAVKTLLEDSQKLQSSAKPARPAADRHTIRAAVTLALDSAMPAMIEELTERVLLALSHHR